MVLRLLLAAALLFSGLPASAAPDYSIEGSAPVTIPFGLEANHIIIDVAIDGHPTRAIFDTGGSDLVTPEFAKAIGLKAVGHDRAAGAGEGSVAVQHTQVDDLRFGTIDLRAQRFAVLPLPGALQHSSARLVEALVGAEILHRFATRLDYAAHTLTFTPADAFEYQGDGVPIPLQFGGSTPRAEGSIDGIPGLLQIDTGSSASLTLTSAFVAGHDLERKYHSAGNVVMGRGVGGYTRGDIARAKTVMLGPVEIDDPVIELSTDKRGAFASNRYAANLGTDVLSRFTITFDYSRKVMYLEQTSAGTAPPPYNRTGMYVQNDDPAFYEIAGILPNGPAAEAGLRVGDLITGIDGRPAGEINGSDFWRLMRGPVGTQHLLEVRRAGSSAPLTLTLTLREVV